MKKNTVLAICVFLISLYLLASFEEYFIHKYIMHNKINFPYLKELYEEHIKHHIDTNEDYTIKKNDHTNICFTFTTTIPLFIITIFILYFLFNKIISFNIILFSIIIIIIIHIVVWNSLHSYVHYFDVNTICKNAIIGIPKEYINEKNIYVKWSLDNHRAHHFYKNEQKGNWNIVFPGADYILGTYNTLPNKY